MYVLDNPIRPYAWGSTTTIPELLGVAPDGRPQAELWMGAHPASPSYAGDRSLLDLIEADPDRELGPAVVAEFGVRLPFLLKLLAAADPLSLQAHPDPAQAREGFERENAAGIPLSAPERSYQDAYAKPELICALSRFEALVGFRPVDGILADADKLGVPELATYLRPLREGPDVEGMRRCFTALMSAPEDERRRVVKAVLTAASSASAASPAGFPIADLMLRLGARHPGDPGVIAALLLNHVVLSPGEALYLPAGNLHAYIEGFGVEILANSDNVLRGGLTGKHVNVPELLSILDFTPRTAEILHPANDPASAGVDEVGATEAVYVTQAREFRLSRLDLNAVSALDEGHPRPKELDEERPRPIRGKTADGAVELQPAGPQILLCTSGKLELRTAERATELTPGRSAYVGAAESAVTVTGSGTLFRATVNLP